MCSVYISPHNFLFATVKKKKQKKTNTALAIGEGSVL